MQNNILFRNISYKFFAALFGITAISVLTACGNGGDAGGSTGTTTSTTVGTIQLFANPGTVNSDGSTSSTITLTAVSATNSTVANATIAVATDTGLLSSSLVTTDSTGKASVTFTSGSIDRSNRTATITATAGSATATTQIQVVGSTVTLSSTTTSIPPNATFPATLTITAKDSGGNAIPGATVTLSQAGSGVVTFNPIIGTTDATGKLTVSVAGTTAGNSTVTVTAAGATATIDYTVTATVSTFGIDQTTLNANAPIVPTSPKTAPMQIGDSLVVRVATGTSTNVAFATTIGLWNATSAAVIVTPAGGFASATLTTTSAGVANVQVIDLDTIGLSDSMTVGMTAKTPSRISLQASPTVIPKTVGTATGISNLTATVYDINGAPVGGIPVAFSIVNGSGTNSGETISPVIVYTASNTNTGLPLGAAPTTFTAGTLSSAAGGVQVRASVVNTAISTRAVTDPATTSSLDAAIVVGGTSGSVAFGQASKIIDAGGTSTIYSFPFSVLVADSNGSPVNGAVVNISTWPIAFNTGANCTITGTYKNEDVNENLVLDAGEDGTRAVYPTGATATGASDNIITPLNSYGGTIKSTNASDLPGTATTDATGLATFNLTYTKSSAIWTIARIRAQTVVQGSPAVAEIIFPLAASKADVDTTAVPPVCELPDSPFNY